MRPPRGGTGAAQGKAGRKPSNRIDGESSTFASPKATRRALKLAEREAFAARADARAETKAAKLAEAQERRRERREARERAANPFSAWRPGDIMEAVPVACAACRGKPLVISHARPAWRNGTMRHIVLPATCDGPAM